MNDCNGIILAVRRTFLLPLFHYHSNYISVLRDHLSNRGYWIHIG